MLFPPWSVGSALGGLDKKFDLISLKKNPNPPWAYILKAMAGGLQKNA
jgi:hypothetical protein